ncbi:response regulator [Pseudomonas sp. Marseille-Q7302]
MNRLVLIAEDERLLAEMLRDIFEEHECEVLVFSTADDACRYLEQKHPPLDLLFTDVRMPGSKTGLDLALSARRLQPTLPIVVSSGYFDGPTQHLSEMTLLPKPWNLERLLTVCSLKRS